MPVVRAACSIDVVEKEFWHKEIFVSSMNLGLVIKVIMSLA